MDRPEICPKDVYEIMKSCWAKSPYDRPLFAHIVEGLSNVMKQNVPSVSQYIVLLSIQLFKTFGEVLVHFQSQTFRKVSPTSIQQSSESKCLRKFIASLVVFFPYVEQDRLLEHMTFLFPVLRDDQSPNKAILLQLYSVLRFSGNFRGTVTETIQMRETAFELLAWDEKVFKLSFFNFGSLPPPTQDHPVIQDAKYPSVNHSILKTVTPL